MVKLVTLAQAKRHLRIFHSDEDADVADKVNQASEIVTDYCQRPDLVWSAAVDGDPDASPPTDDIASDAPFRVQAAVLMVLDDLWEHRGAAGETGQADGYLSKPVTALLHRTMRLSYA